MEYNLLPNVVLLNPLVKNGTYSGNIMKISRNFTTVISLLFIGVASVILFLVVIPHHDRRPLATSFGYIDKSGKPITGLTFSVATDYSDGFARVKKKWDTNWYFIDRKGNLLTKRGFAESEPFSDGMAAVAVSAPTQSHLVDRHKRWTYLSKKGTLISSTFEEAKPFAEGLAVVKEGGKYGVIDKTGTFVVMPTFDDSLERFEEGRLGLKLQKRWQFIDHAGRVAIAKSFLNVLPFREGLAPIKLDDGQWTFIDQNGLELKRRFGNAVHFQDGLALVRPLGSTDGHDEFIDKTGQTVLDTRKLHVTGPTSFLPIEVHTFPLFFEGLVSASQRQLDGSLHRGFVDKSGTVAIPFNFVDGGTIFSEGVSAVAIAEGSGEKWGFIDKRGSWVIKPIYNFARDFHEERAVIGN
jgi:hypothetical protein